MKLEEGLGGWRRTHYSIQITPDLDGKEVTVFGWVSSVRTHGGITSSSSPTRRELPGHGQQGEGEQGDSREGRRAKAAQQHRGAGESSRRSPRRPTAPRSSPRRSRYSASRQRSLPSASSAGRLPSLDKRLDIRAVDLRREKAQAIFRIQRGALLASGSSSSGRGYLEVRTPKLISTATEGGASLFSVLYYNRPSFLTQSPQLYKEELVMPFEKVYEIGPAFRAEESRTQKHLSEITSIDIEEAFVDYSDVMDTLEALIKHGVASRSTDSCARSSRS